MIFDPSNERIIKEVDSFRTKLKEKAKKYNVGLDIGWELDNICNRKSSILGMLYFTQSIEGEIEWEYTLSSFSKEEQKEIMKIIRKLSHKLKKIDSSLESSFEQIISTKKWIEDMKEVVIQDDEEDEE
ncbi:MAG: hypothetical protein BHV99_04960 [Clostridium sp. 26_21]|nr:MAG: hypothetical protein BHV99_04960 [Clostridium sp. 26_21]